MNSKLLLFEIKYFAELDREVFSRRLRMQIVLLLDFILTRLGRVARWNCAEKSKFKLRPRQRLVPTPRTCLANAIS